MVRPLGFYFIERNLRCGSPKSWSACICVYLLYQL